MNKEIKVSRIQIRGLIVSTVIGVGVLSLPFDLANTMDNKGWMAIIISGLLTIPIIYIINKIFEQNPKKDFFQIGEEALGKVLFTICKIIILAYLVVLMSYVTRTLGELIKAFLLPTTPTEVIVLTFILTCSYIASYEIDVIARAGYFTYPIILIFAAIIILISLPNADFSNLLPITNIDLTKFPAGIKASILSFAGFEIILFALPFVENKEGVFKSCIYAIVEIVIFYVLMFVMVISHFSIKQIQRQNYPVLQLAKKIDLPGYFLENLDGLVMTVWIIIIFATVIPIYFGAGKTISKIFNTKKHKYFIWALVPIVYFVAFAPDNFVTVNKVMLFYFNILALFSIVLIPSLIFAVDSFKKRVKS